MSKKIPVKTKSVTAKKPGKKTAKPRLKTSSASKKKPVKKNVIPLKFNLGNTELSGFLKPLEKLTPWGIPESYEIHIKGQPVAIISIATGVWVIQDFPHTPQIIDPIIKHIEDFYSAG